MAYKRSIFIINKRFQFRFSAIVCVFIFLVGLPYPMAIYDLMKNQVSLAKKITKSANYCHIGKFSSIDRNITMNDTQYEVFKTCKSNALPKPEVLSSSLEEKRDYLIMVLLLWHFAVTALVFVGSLLFSHKIAGPIYKLQKFLTAVRDGRDCGKLYFRNGDHFPELAEDFNDAFGRVQEDYKNDFVYISEVNAYLTNLAMVVPDDKKVVLKEVTKRLSEIQNRFQGS